MPGRRTSLAAGAGVLLASSLVVAPPASASGTDGIFVRGGDRFEISALSSTSMLESEELQVLPLIGSQGSYIVRNFDALADDLGRPILASMGGCEPATGLAAQLVCTFSAAPLRLSVNFSAVQGNATFVMMEGTSLPLVYLGGAGRDYVQAGSGDDFLVGNGGADSFFGGPGDDLLGGEAGDDYLEGESGRDEMRGGPGSNSLDAADGVADIRIDCGGVPKLLDFDEGLDTPDNCGANPTPIPPAPLEPVDPPAPGEGEGAIEGVPTTVEVTQDPAIEGQVTVTTGPTGPILATGLTWLVPPNTTVGVPAFPSFRVFPMSMSPLFPESQVEFSLWAVPSGSVGPNARVERAAPLDTVAVRVDAQGVARGNVPVPQGQPPGDYVLQVNAVTAAGAPLTINIGVVLAEETPGPDPGPDQSIAITSANRGKKPATITVRGTSTGLAGGSVTPRYRILGAKGWTMAQPVAVTDQGSFTWRLTTPKKVRIQVVAGAVRSPAVVVAAVRR